MPRHKREYGQSGIYHIIIRGNDKQSIFLDDFDYKLMLTKIEKYSKELKIQVYAYCLLDNHVHLLIGNGNEYMSKFMLKLNTSYSRSFNIKYERTGHLFQGRYLSKPIEDDKTLKTVVRYILQNPEKIGLGNCDEYVWNSFQEIVSKEINGEDDNKDEAQKSERNICNKRFLFNVFCSEKEFISFVLQKNYDECMDYEGKTVLNDSHCRKIIIELLNIENPENLKRYDIEFIKEKIKILLEYGISQNQIARITGINRHIIRKIKAKMTIS